MTDQVLIWDRTDEPSAGWGHVLHWRTFASSASSVPAHLELHAERLRARYLRFIHDMGEYRIRGKRLVDHLDRGDGFSFWWMTLLAEKSPLKSPRIYDCLRLFALEEMLLERKPRGAKLVSADAVLAQSVKDLCSNLGIAFEWQRLDGAPARLARRVFNALPPAAKGLLSLRHLARLRPLRALRRAPWFAGTGATFFCSYFIHLDPAQCSQGTFHSRQWEQLPRVIEAAGRKANWLHLFLFSTVVPDVATGLGWANRFNADASAQGRHSFIDGYLDSRILARMFRTWRWLRAAGTRLGREALPAFRPHGSAVSLWPMLSEDWHASFHGAVSMSNCLWVEQFDVALAEIPKQPVGLFLYENQSWEKAFLRAWRRHGHGRIVGVQHATAPYWFLGYLNHADSLQGQGPGALPFPDLVAVNGVASLKEFLACGYPRDKLAEVEALRYLGLAGLATQRIGSPARPASEPVRVLVVGDIVPTSTRHLLELLAVSRKSLEGRFHFTFKPHPGYQPNLADFPELDARQTRQSLSEILADFDVVVAANGTSAAVDAYVAGLPVIVGLDGEYLNQSPLRGQPGARFVSTAQELATALLAAMRENASPLAAARTQFFFLDERLPRWRSLLELPPAMADA